MPPRGGQVAGARKKTVPSIEFDYKAHRLGLPRVIDDPNALLRSIKSRLDEIKVARHTTREVRQLELQLAHMSSVVRVIDNPCAESAHRLIVDSGTVNMHYEHLPHRSGTDALMNLGGVRHVPAAHAQSDQGDIDNQTRREVVDMDTCPHCKVPLKVCIAKGTMVCDQCGLSNTYVDVTVTALPYNTSIDMSNFSYKRINHFNDWLLQIQGKEGKSVPDEVCEQVSLILARENITDMTKVTNQKVRDILKSLRMNKMYDHVTQITCRVTGRDPPRISVDAEEKCRLMFIAIQAPFERHCPAERKNFLSYPYCLFKFLELLECTELLPLFVLLKGKDKLYKQDVIFKKICKDLNWEFIPSV